MKAKYLLIAGAAALPLMLTAPASAQLTPPSEQFTMNDSRANGRMETRTHVRDRDRGAYKDRAYYNDSERRHSARSSREWDERAITDDLNAQSLEDARS